MAPSIRGVKRSDINGFSSCVPRFYINVWIDVGWCTDLKISFGSFIDMGTHLGKESGFGPRCGRFAGIFHSGLYTFITG